MIGRVAILGLGRRGGHWAEIFLAAGWEARGFDPDDRAGQGLAGSAAWQRETTITGAVAHADWVLCCLPERLELLRALIQRAQASAPNGALIAVASDTYDIEAIQSCAAWPGQVIRLIAGPSGAMSFDVSGQNNAEIRDHARETLSSLSAAATILPGPDAKIVPLPRKREA